VTTLLGGAAVAGQAPSPAPVRTAATIEMSDSARQAVFAELTTCRAKVIEEFDEDPSVRRTPPRSVSAKAGIARDKRARKEVIDAGYAECAAAARDKHSVSDLDLQRILSMGTCKRWAPLTGKPTC
jgi:hypothetical protein